MSILIPHDATRPLDQGDILADIVVFRTRPDGLPEEHRPPFVMVLSRSCNALRDEHIVVAPVELRAHPELKKVDSPRELIEAFLSIRDGRRAPDSFYLGAIPPTLGRYVARLDQLFSIELPRAGAGRTDFLTKHRRFHLDTAFRRDLHLRVFRAFGSLGFDDEGWWSDEDLKLIVERADLWQKAIAAEKDKLEANHASDVAGLASSGEEAAKATNKANNKHKEGVSQLDKRAKEFEDQVKPLREELARRQAQKP